MIGHRSRPPRLGAPARVLSLGAALCGVVLFGAGCAVLAPLGGGAGSAAHFGDGPGDRVLAASSVTEAVRDLPKARRGNAREYTVRGRRYRTLDSAAGFRERGIASWYGAKFHGRETSSGEPFDMHAMTAAHRRLPLPTFVRVTHVGSGRAVTVKVNDRGPFVDDRVIDLSYAAALALGVLESGTAEVELEALSTHVPPAPLAPPKASEPSGRSEPTGAPSPESAVAVRGTADFVQLGAFRDAARARALAWRVEPHLPPRAARVEHDAERALWHVRVGPLAGARALEEVLAALARAGVEDYTLMTSTPR